MRVLILGLLALAVTACSNDPGIAIPSQQWKGFEISLQTRPPTPRAGMNEFLVITTGERNKPIHDLIVSLRISSDRPWRQAIQDGRTGVYRRALAVDDPESQRLAVQIKRGDEEHVLFFPLTAPMVGATG